MIENVSDMTVLGNTSGDSSSPSEITIHNENNMSSNSSTALATQSSIKAYVDSVATGLDVKKSCVVATTENITLTGVKTIDGISVSSDQRVSLKIKQRLQKMVFIFVSGQWLGKSK